MQIVGTAIIRLRKENDQVVQQNKQFKEIVGGKLDHRIIKERAIKIKNQNHNKLLPEELQKTMRMSKSLTN
jgi:hypothetical protein